MLQYEPVLSNSFLFHSPELSSFVPGFSRVLIIIRNTIDPAVKATFDGTTVRVGKEGRILYEQNGYGRLEPGGVKLSNQEALYLLHRGKIDVTGFTFDTLFSVLAEQPGFLRSFLVYRDMRERGYVVQTGPHDFRVFKRGEKPGSSESLYLVRVLSERDPIRFKTLIEEVIASRNMRKQYVLAVVDDEEELTYYEIKIQKLPEPVSQDHGGFSH